MAVWGEWAILPRPFCGVLAICSGVLVATAFLHCYKVHIPSIFGFDSRRDTMAKKEDAQNPEETSGAPQQPVAAGQPTITVSENNVEAHYANFCRVMSTPEELVLDLGLNPQPYATGP